MRRPRIELALIVLLAVALVGLLVFRPSPGPDADAEPAIAAPAPCQAALVDAPSVEPAGPKDLASVAAVVERLRDLRFEEVPAPAYLPSPEFAGRVTEDVPFTDEEVELEGRVLALLGAIPEGFPLKEHLLDAAAEEVIGFYDPTSGELVVRADTGPEELGPEEELTLAHELGHALADQAVGLPDLAALGAQDAERAAAARALVEGDAMILTQLYAAEALSLADQLALATAVPGATALEESPHFILRSVTFPYFEGMTFVCALYRERGWRAVDEAYAAPPTTTAEILFPERHLDGEEERRPEEPRGLLAHWEPEPPRSFGAADVLFLSEAPGGDPGRMLAAPEEVAAAWAGGALHVWTSGARLAASVRLVEREGAVDLCTATAAWYRRSFPAVRWTEVDETLRTARHDDRGAALRCVGDEVRLGIAPDVPTAVRASE